MTEIRLRWWAVVLPAVVFVALLTLLVSGAEADSRTAARDRDVTQPVTALVDQVRQVLFP